ncbi:MAG: 4'-phosphopantetheinyl transferase superfamily protein [Treponema sp.]|jgi:phosphopantetheinyl transferase|nr:4'-phosphopantetheinyl transferase superfamily protein [Treponema sp.]
MCKKNCWQSGRSQRSQCSSLSIGLSYISHSKTETHIQHSEGLRLLRLIDARYFSHVLCSEIETEACGRPFFTNRHADFNISHSKNMIAVGYVPSYAPSDFTPCIGCDIQFMDERKNMDGIAKRAFSSAERQFLVSAADSVERLTRFYQIWTFKESYIKLHGLSVFDMLKAPDFTCAFFQEDSAFCQYRLGNDASERYIVCCMWKTPNCAENAGKEARPEICWFSESTLSCRILRQ